MTTRERLEKKLDEANQHINRINDKIGNLMTRRSVAEETVADIRLRLAKLRSKKP